MHRGTSHPYAGTVRQTDPVRVAESFVASRFPAALGVVLAGSAAAGTSTPTSDVDLLLLGSEEMFDGGASSLAATFEHEGRLVEVFAYTPESFRTWAERAIEKLRPVTLAMLRDGVVLRESPALLELRAWATHVLDAGPSIAQHELDVRRYHVSALLDDLSDASDPVERAHVLGESYRSLAELLLLTHGRWIGSGKWLVRRLREWDADVAQSLGDCLAAGDAAATVARAEELLAPLGGRLQAGMVR